MNDHVIDERGSIRLTPTLVVGLGGTGVNVVRRVKQSLHDFFTYRNLGGIPPILRFLAIDSVSNSRGNREIELDDPEYLYLGSVNGSAVVENKRFNPQVSEWWDYRRSAPGHIDNGCGQMRDLGRLIFFANYRSFHSAIERQINALRDKDNLAITEQRGFNLLRNQLHICVVCSIAGGTGSGMFLDVSYNLRDAVNRYTGITPGIVGYLVLPEVYTPKLDSVAMEEAVQANSFAALAELEYLNRNPEKASEFFHSYPVGPNISAKSRPFDHAFLVGIRDENGERLASPDDVYDAIAQKIFLESTYLDRAIREHESNMFADRDAGGALADTKIGRYYSSFTVATVSIRRDIALAYCQHRLALDVFSHLLQKSAADETTLPALPSDITAASFTSEFTSAIDGQHPFPALVDSKEVESQPLIDTLDGNDRMLNSWLAGIQGPLQEGTRTKRRELQNYLHEQVWDLALDHGIDAIFPYLQQWQTLLQTSANELNGDVTKFGAEADAEQRAYEHDRAELEELSLGPGLGGILTFRDSTAKRRHRRERLFDSAEKHLQSWFKARLRQMIARQINNTIVHSLLGDTMHDERGSITRLLFQWREIKDTLQAVQRDLRALLGDLEDDIAQRKNDWYYFEIARVLTLTRDDLDQLYTKIADVFDKRAFVQQIADSVEQVIDDDEATHTAATVPQALRNRTLAIARAACLPLFRAAGDDDEQDDRSKAAAEEVRLAFSRGMGRYLDRHGVLGEMFRYNAPFWNYFQGVGAKERFELINLVAVESENPPGWHEQTPEDILSRGGGGGLPDEMGGDQRVITGDPSLLGVFRATYGLPLYLINEIASLREAYELRRERNVQDQDGANSMSLHIHTRWNDELPCDPTVDLKGEALPVRP